MGTLRPTCARHPKAAAGWQCHDCNRALCPECTATKRFHPVDLLVCCLCGGRADVLRIRRSSVPLQEQLPGILRYPVSKQSLPTLIGMSLVITIFQAAIAMIDRGKDLFPVLWAAAGLAVLNATYLIGIVFGWMTSIAAKTAANDEPLEGIEVTGLWRSVVRPAALAVAGSAFLWIPLAARILAVGSAQLRDPVLWLIGGLAICFTPSIIVGGAAGSTILEMLNPLRTVSRAFALGSAYLPALLLTAAAFVPSAVLQELSIRAWAVVPVLGPWLLQLLAVYPAVVVARAVGILLRNNGDKLGYGIDSDYLDPALPGVEPRGSGPATS